LGAENTKIDGTGLGLALSKQIMLAMHGSIDVAKDKSLFWIEIPATTASHTSSILNHDTDNKPSFKLSNNNSILYVEDNVSNRALVEAIIQRQQDLRIHSVATVKDAKRFLKDMVPSLILIDLNLPDGSGEDLVSHVKSKPELHHIPMMILSADALPETMERLKSAGVAHYMTKPLDVAAFSKKVRELIGAERKK
jgi:CheY-like chemotaxis protein